MRPVAHPTTYRGTRFRSRLEARWAAFFDLAGWQWIYEPGDYEGWAPDFALVGEQDTTLVEVKPIEWSGSRAAMEREALARTDLEKFWGQHGREVLLLGSYPVKIDDSAAWGMALGLLHNEQWTGGQADRSRCDLAALWAGHKHVLDFSASDGSYAYRMGGQYDGDGHLRPVDHILIDHLWGAASRLTQWRAR